MRKILVFFLAVFIAMSVLPLENVAVSAEEKKPSLDATWTDYSSEFIDLKNYAFSGDTEENESVAEAICENMDEFYALSSLINENVCLAYLASFNDDVPDENNFKAALLEMGIENTSPVYTNSDDIFFLFGFLQQYKIEQLRINDCINEIYNLASTLFATSLGEAVDLIPDYENTIFFEGATLFDSLFVSKLIASIYYNNGIQNYLKNYIGESCFENYGFESVDNLAMFYLDPNTYLAEVYQPGDYIDEHMSIFNTDLPEPLDAYLFGDLISIYVSLNKTLSRIECGEYIFDFYHGSYYKKARAEELISVFDTFDKTSFFYPDEENEEQLANFLSTYYVENENIAYTMGNTRYYKIYKGGVWLDEVLRFFMDIDYEIADKSVFYNGKEISLSPYKCGITYGEAYDFMKLFLNRSSMTPDELSALLSSIKDFDYLEELVGVDLSHLEDRFNKSYINWNFNNWLANVFTYFVAVANYYSTTEYVSICGALEVVERYISSIYYDEYYSFNFIDLTYFSFKYGYSPAALATAAKNIDFSDISNYLSGNGLVNVETALLDQLDEESLINLAAYKINDPSVIVSSETTLETMTGRQLIPDTLPEGVTKTQYVTALIEQAEKELLCVTIDGICYDLVNGTVLTDYAVDDDVRYSASEKAASSPGLNKLDLFNYFYGYLRGAKAALLDDLSNFNEEAAVMLAIYVCNTTTDIQQLDEMLDSKDVHLIPSELPEGITLDQYVASMVQAAETYIGCVECNGIFYDLVNGKVLNNVDGISYSFIAHEGVTYGVADSIYVAPVNDDTFCYRTIKDNTEEYLLNNPVTFFSWAEYFQLAIVQKDSTSLDDGTIALFDALYNTPLEEAGLGGYKNAVPALLISMFTELSYEQAVANGESTDDITEENTAKEFMEFYNDSVFFAYGLYLMSMKSYNGYTPLIPYIATPTDLSPAEQFAAIQIVANASYANITDYTDLFETYNISPDHLVALFSNNASNMASMIYRGIINNMRFLEDIYGHDCPGLDTTTRGLNRILPFYLMTDSEYIVKDLKKVRIGDCYVDLINMVVYPAVSHSDDVEIPENVAGTSFGVVAVNRGFAAGNSNISSVTLPSTLLGVESDAFYGLTLNTLDFYRETEFYSDVFDTTTVKTVNAHGIDSKKQTINAPSLLIPSGEDGSISIMYDSVDGITFKAPEGAEWELPITSEDGETFTIDDLFDFSTYQITIPTAITITDGTKEEDLDLTGLNLSKLASGVQVSASSSNSWKLSSGETGVDPLEYTIDIMDDDGNLYKFTSEGDEKKTMTITVENPKYSGTYTDTITFEYELEGIEDE